MPHFWIESSSPKISATKKTNFPKISLLICSMESFWVQTAISAIRALAFVVDVISFPVYLILQRPWKRRQLSRRVKVSEFCPVEFQFKSRHRCSYPVDLTLDIDRSETKANSPGEFSAKIPCPSSDDNTHMSMTSPAHLNRIFREKARKNKIKILFLDKIVWCPFEIERFQVCLLFNTILKTIFRLRTEEKKP